MFVGRTDVLELIDRLVEVPVDDTDVPVKPVLVLEGCGGSGRTSILERALATWWPPPTTVWERLRGTWRRSTPTVLIHPLERPVDDDDPARPLLASILLGLSQGIPGYTIAFPRVLVAQIAISADFDGAADGTQRVQLRTLLNRHRNRTVLFEFIRTLAALGGTQAANFQVPDDIASAVLDRAADIVIHRLSQGRLVNRLTWGPAVPWFGHQDQQLHADPERVLIELSLKSRSPDRAVRQGVDDVLIGALLADLRHSAAKVAGRTSNVLVLLDDGDAPATVSFTGSLLRVRRALAATGRGPTDPLTVITTSSGTLITELAGQIGAPEEWTEPVNPARVTEVTAPWLTVRLADLPESDVGIMAKAVDPIEYIGLGAEIHRLTHGHPATTSYLLGELRDDSTVRTRFDELLRRPGPERGKSVEEHLLRVFVRALTPHREAPDLLTSAIITASAARDRGAARAVVTRLHTDIAAESPLLTSRTLWTGREDAARLPSLVRLLGLRLLAVRNDPLLGWERVFGELLAAVSADDRTGRLYYERLLNGRGAVVTALADELPRLEDVRWLAMFDAIVATPDPRDRDRDLIDDGRDRPTPADDIAMLIAVVPTVDADLRAVSEDVEATLCMRAARSYERLANTAVGGDPFLLRAARYRARAQRYH
ncbi:hypothetical protein [Nocardia arizonensis]|uniref:hypothetical protein n=1 Tax=Nocardia arizonensis TaxID=1141647 RepID=UPI0006D07725|nr:hypothetical protein [Nocardia arizonensis]